MGSSSGGYDQAREAIEQGMGQQRQLIGQAQQYFNPYYQAGVGAIGPYQQAVSQGQDPAALYNNMMSGYRESPELQAQIAAGEQGASRAASAAGMLGSGAELKNAASIAQGLRADDVQKYLDRVLGIRNQYLQGEGSLAGMGSQAAGSMGGLYENLAQDIGQGYGGIGQSYIGEAQQPTLGQQILGGLGTAGGLILGGPIGGSLYDKLFGKKVG